MSERIQMGTLPIDRLTFAEAIDAIDALVTAGKGGYVLTPNVDHVVVAESDKRFREAYADASLSLVDGMPLLWAAKLLGEPLPEKISGSDLAIPLMLRAAERKWRVYLLGAGPGVADEAAEILVAKYGVKIVGTDAPFISVEADPSKDLPALEKLKAAKPDLVVVAFGAPKQELFIHRMSAHASPAVMLGLGATLDFITGRVQRAPTWMSRSGLEWLYRLTREPKRLWRRYLVNDPKFIGVLARQMLARRPPGRPS